MAEVQTRSSAGWGVILTLFMIYLFSDPAYTYTIDASCDAFPNGVATIRQAADEATNMALYGALRITNLPQVDPAVINALLGSQGVAFLGVRVPLLSKLS